LRHLDLCVDRGLTDLPDEGLCIFKGSADLIMDISESMVHHRYLINQALQTQLCRDAELLFYFLLGRDFWLFRVTNVF
jgi:hypothetical protein